MCIYIYIAKLVTRNEIISQNIQRTNVRYLPFPENPGIRGHLFPHQSKSDAGDDADRSALDVSPGPQTQQTEQKTSDEIQASDFSRTQLVQETDDPSRHQLYKIPVPADPEENSDLYFIGKSEVCGAPAQTVTASDRLLQYIHHKNLIPPLAFPRFSFSGFISSSVLFLFFSSLLLFFLFSAFASPPPSTGPFSPLHVFHTFHSLFRFAHEIFVLHLGE